MTVRVYSPNAGIPVRLKVEDAADPTHSVRPRRLTTGVNTWETLTFDFANQAPGTVVLNLAWTFNKFSIFFNFGTDGSRSARTKTYYFDDIAFGGGSGGGGATWPTITLDNTALTYTFTGFGGDDRVARHGLQSAARTRWRRP